MIKLEDIKLAINKIIKSIPKAKLVSEDTTENLPRPCFKVIFCDYNASMCGTDNIEQSLIVRIYYFSSDLRKKSEEIMKIQELMLLKFIEPIRVTDTFVVHPKDYVDRTVDGVLQISFELEFIQSLNKEDASELMDSIELKL